ncbi:MAG: hypothetical protein M1828_005450 [Chrysothrix sp. TS-e1954]|nr:MAG: hypothetical protein M1828_005450 [Chrysothrix sp. TS-e1954]
MAPMQIRNPRRILILGQPDSGALTLLKDLTGTAPEPRTLPTPSPTDPTTETTSQHQAEPHTRDTQPPNPLQTTTAGLTHTLSLRNKYYNADIPIWLDELPLPDSTNEHPPQTWSEDFRAPEAGEVVKAVGAWIVVFRRRRRRNAESAGAAEGSQVNLGQDDGERWDADEALALMRAVKSVIEHWDPDYDGCLLCVGMPLRPSPAIATKPPTHQEHVWLQGRKLELGEWEDECFDLGFECIDGGGIAGVRSITGERQGVDRLKEALEANEWESADDDLDLEALGLDDDNDGEAFGAFSGPNGQDADEDAGFGIERRQVENEFMGLKLEMAEQREDGPAEERRHEGLQVDELERMMAKLSGVREMTAHMSEKERKRVAARMVNEMAGDL